MCHMHVRGYLWGLMKDCVCTRSHKHIHMLISPHSPPPLIHAHSHYCYRVLIHVLRQMLTQLGTFTHTRRPPNPVSASSQSHTIFLSSTLAHRHARWHAHLPPLLLQEVRSYPNVYEQTQGPHASYGIFTCTRHVLILSSPFPSCSFNPSFPPGLQSFIFILSFSHCFPLAFSLSPPSP